MTEQLSFSQKTTLSAKPKANVISGQNALEVFFDLCLTILIFKFLLFQLIVKNCSCDKTRHAFWYQLGSCSTRNTIFYDFAFLIKKVLQKKLTLKNHFSNHFQNWFFSYFSFGKWYYSLIFSNPRACLNVDLTS